MYYTYVMRSKKDGKFYTGHASDLRKRFSQHNRKSTTSTKDRAPFELIYYEACVNEYDALAREKYLKSGMGKRYLKNRLKRFLSLTGWRLSKEKDYTNYQFAGQHEGEKVELVFRQHPIVMRRRLIGFLLIVLVAALPLQFAPLEGWPWWVLLAGFLAGLLVMGHRFIGWFYSLFIITDERLIQIIQKGFFNRQVSDISHAKIQSVNYEIKGVQASMFGYGTIVVQTYVGNMVLPYIYKPETVHQLMVKQMRGAPSSGPSIIKTEGE